MIICYKDNQQSTTIYNLYFDGKHRDKYSSGWTYNLTDSENLLCQQPTQNDSVTVEAPQQVDPNTFQTIK